MSSAPEEPEGGSWKDGVLEMSPCLDMLFPERMELGVPALEDVSFSLMGEIDLARSALRACLSCRPVMISSSSLLVRSSSSISRFRDRSLMRNRKSLTSSEPSLLVVIGIVRCVFQMPSSSEC